MPTTTDQPESWSELLEKCLDTIDNRAGSLRMAWRELGPATVVRRAHELRKSTDLLIEIAERIALHNKVKR